MQPADHPATLHPLVLAQRGAGEAGGQGQGTAPTEGADGSGPGGPQGGGQGAQPQSPLGGGFMFILFGILLFFIIASAWGGRKQKKQREQMLSGLAKHDKIQTIGGVIGTIAEIKDNEIVLRVDDRADARIRFARSAVQQILRKGRGDTDNEQADADADTEAEEEAPRSTPQLGQQP